MFSAPFGSKLGKNFKFFGYPFAKLRNQNRFVEHIAPGIGAVLPRKHGPNFVVGTAMSTRPIFDMTEGLTYYCRLAHVNMHLGNVMTIQVNIDLGYKFSVKANFQSVFDTLSDVPASARHFPKVDQLIDMGDGIYRWEMAKIGLPQINLQTVYASKYLADRAKGSVIWTRVPGEGNAMVSGSWNIQDKKKNTHLELNIQGELTLPLPGFMKMVVGPVVQGEFEKMVEQYIHNLTQHFGGEA